MSILDKALAKVRDKVQVLKALAQLALGGYDSTQVDEQVYNERMSTCRSCPKFGGLNQCGVCGCFMNIKARLMYDPVETDKHPDNEKQLTKCPLGNW